MKYLKMVLIARYEFEDRDQGDTSIIQALTEIASNPRSWLRATEYLPHSLRRNQYSQHCGSDF